MAEEKKIWTEETTKDGKRYRRIYDGDHLIGTEELGEVKAMKPNTPPATAESATEATAPASSTTESVKPAEPEQKKGLSAKVKRGLAIGGGVIGGLAAYALGVRRGKDEGTAEGYQEGYADGRSSVETSADVSETWEAQE